MRISYAAFILCLMFASHGFAQESNGTDPDNRILKVTLAKTDADGNIVEDPSEFTPGDIPIYCYVDLNEDEPASITVRYIAVKAKGLRPNTLIVKLQHKTKQGDTGASFHASPAGKWAEGDYAVEVYIDGQLSETRTFRVSP